MPIATKLRSFKERRIDVPVGPEALVLDVGSGDKPSWRADVLLDGYPDQGYDGQRSGTGGTRVVRPLFEADAADMPFADQVFDYVICSHVLEHVPDPGAVIAELVRVARAGYIEVPEAASSKLLDFPTHLWWCRLDETTTPPTLVLTAKQTPYFDREIHDYLRRSGLEGKVDRMLRSRLHHNIVPLRWVGSVPFRVEGALDPDFVRSTTSAEAPHHGGITLVARLLTRVLTGRGHASRPLRLDDVLRPELRTGTGELLAKKIYRLGPRRPDGAPAPRG